MSFTVSVKTAELIAILEKNRARHRKVFEAALEGWKAQALEALERKAESLRRGRIPELHIALVTPQDRSGDYDRVIRMLAMHTGEEIELDEAEAAMYVEDDWGWTRQWTGTVTSYASDAYLASYGN
jgi:hypothetical protein